MKAALYINQFLHKEIKPPKVNMVVTWYFLFILFFFLLFIGSVIYLLLVVMRNEPAHPREIIIPCGTLGWSYRKVKHFWTTKVVRK
jgi:hypothetical protein